MLPKCEDCRGFLTRDDDEPFSFYENCDQDKNKEEKKMKIENLDTALCIVLFILGISLGLLVGAGGSKDIFCDEAKDKGFVLYHCK